MRARTITVMFVLALLLAALANRSPAYAAQGAALSMPLLDSIAGCAPLTPTIAQGIEAGEPWYCPINQQLYDQWVKDLPLAGVAVLLAFSIAAIITMVGIALKSDRIRNFGIGELYEATASAMIVGIFLYICAVLFGVLPAVLVSNISPFPTAFNFITSTIQAIQNTYTVYYHQVYRYKFLASITPYVEITNVPNLIPTLLRASYQLPLQMLLIAPLTTLCIDLADGLAVLWAEYYLLVFFSIAAIPVFLVPGVVFRSIFPTRALGGMLIALAIAFYLVMPSLFAVVYYFTTPGLLQNLQSSVQSMPSVTGSDITDIATPTNPLVLQIQGAEQSMQGAMSSFWLMIFFYPLLIIAVSYAFVTQIANFIGGAARTGGRMRGFV
jgi:hypothetical protein